MKKLTPQQAKTFKQICSLKTDNCGTPRSWISVDVGVVCIYNQRNGESSTGNVTLSRADFERFIRWYMTGSAR